MVRKLVRALLSISLMAPAAALALGLGDIKLNSALNQRLNADIELLSVEPGEADDIQVSLASADTFSKIGITRPAFLLNVKFDVQRRSDGSYYVKATTPDIIRDPFLDFLVEVNWPNGRVVREYTLLLDPPVSYTEAAPAVDKAAAGAAAPSAPAEPVKAPASTTTTATTTKTAAAKPEAKPAETKPEETKPATKTQAAVPKKGIVYGPVKSSETLWAIALKVRPNEDISVQQMMMALLKANPYAFSDNNINRLKKGYVLRVDDPALFTAMNKAEAARQVARQTREWEDYRASVAKKAPARKPAAEKQAPAATAAAPKAEPKLKLVAPEGEGAKAGTAAEGEAKNGDINEQLMLALESSAAQRKENEELQSRVEGLEEQLQDMQRLLSLKDADLAALQKQLKEQGEAVSLPSEKVAPAESEGMTAEGEQAAKTEGVGEMAPEGEAETGKMAEGAEVVEPKAAGAPAKTEAKQPEPVKKTEPKPKPKPKVTPPQPAKQQSFIDSLLQDPMMLGAGGGVIVLVLVLAMVLVRRRKGGFQESILSGGTSSMLNTKGDEDQSETSFLSDLAISGMGGGNIAADEGEVDPMTEADVFMAYGRNQQAEEVLKKALETSPNRPDIIAKLLEVYYNTKDTEQFQALASESAAKLQSDKELWGKVAAMGSEMVPDSDLFAGADATGAPAAEPAAKPEPVTDDVLDIGLDLDELTSEMENGDGDESLDLGMDLDLGEDKASGESEEMDFDLDLGAAEETAEAPAAEEEDMGELGDLDFDMGELATEDETLAEEEPSFDLDIGGEETEAAVDLGTEEKPAEDDLGDLGDFDFGDLDLGGEAESGEVTEEAAGDELGEFDLGDLEGDTDDFGDLGDLGDLDDDSLLADSDEIATKLDLAQAYIEMGDNDGARSMLEEVVEGGNDEQKQQAQDLLSKI